MTLQEIKIKLSVEDRIKLISAIALSLQHTFMERSNKQNLIKKMKGFLKANSVPPDDTEFQDILEQHREEKYLILNPIDIGYVQNFSSPTKLSVRGGEVSSPYPITLLGNLGGYLKVTFTNRI